jgi:hypothetical protein
MQATLGNIMAVQEKVVGAGGLGVMVTMENLYDTAARFVEAGGFKNVDSFFTDPRNVPPEARPKPAEDPNLIAAKAAAEVELRKVEIEKEKMILAHKREVMELRLKYPMEWAAAKFPVLPMSTDFDPTQATLGGQPDTGVPDYGMEDERAQAVT